MDNIHQEGAREALMTGIKKAKDTIAGTLGPTGYSLVVEDILYPGHMIVDDGWLALKKIKLANSLEQRGVELLKEAVEKSNKESGDGSTTSTILTSKILEEGLRLNVHGQEIKNSLDKCLPIIEKSLTEQTKQITPLEVGKVATISSGDEKIGALLQEIYEKIGKEGIVELDYSKTLETFYELTEGTRLLNCGFMYSYMANEDKGTRAVYTNPKILITYQPIKNNQDIEYILKALIGGGTNELVIFCNEIAPEVSNTLAMMHNPAAFNIAREPFKNLVIKAPTLWKDWLFEDFAKITGAQIVDGTEKTLKRFNLSWLGTCEKIVTTKDETRVFGTKDISEHLAMLKEAGKKDDQQLLRASWLQTKTAVVKIGSSSDTELSLKRAKIEDARNASYQALQHGIVEGGGKALVKASEELPNTIGGKVLKEALKAPHEQLKQNMNVEEIDTIDVFDPVVIPKNAVRNAISVAGSILTSNGIITLPKE